MKWCKYRGNVLRVSMYTVLSYEVQHNHGRNKRVYSYFSCCVPTQKADSCTKSTHPTHWVGRWNLLPSNDRIAFYFLSLCACVCCSAQSDEESATYSRHTLFLLLPCLHLPILSLFSHNFCITLCTSSIYMCSLLLSSVTLTPPICLCYLSLLRFLPFVFSLPLSLSNSLPLPHTYTLQLTSCS